MTGTHGAEAGQGPAGSAAPTPDPILAPVTAISGVGPAKAKALAQAGIETVRDLLFWLPTGYNDERKPVPVAHLVPGAHQVTVGVVSMVRTAGPRFKQRTEVSVEPLPDAAAGPRAFVKLVWFNGHPSLTARFEHGKRVRVIGEVTEFRGVLSMNHPDVTVLRDDEDALGVIRPRYPEVPGVGKGDLRKIIGRAVEKYAAGLRDVIPADVRAALDLASLTDAVRAVHLPPADLGEAALVTLCAGESEAHERLAVEDLFVMELALHRRRTQETAAGAFPVPRMDGRRLRGARAALGFELTGAQARALDEVGADMAKALPMRRLLQGDVGSGKTAVVLLAAMAAVDAGMQAAILAPTEVLAEQHARTLAALAQATGIRSGLLVGSLKAKAARTLREQMAAGAVDVVVGTHALLGEQVQFARLGLAVVDEQHRFGVGQRLRLAQKGAEGRMPHLLVMTATPIPRSLALTLYGDLEVTVVDEMPPGRVPPVTRAFPREARERALRQVARALDAGGRAYVVCPAVEESDEHELAAAVAVKENLAHHFPKERIELMHGGQPTAEQQRAMGAFASGDARILVATTVIEVGVDVPAANVILIEDANGFGLAQLHQLRGRVGRGGQASACLLVHGPVGEDGEARLRVLCETTDGFRIAEEDLRLRGPGDLFGRRQSGVPGMRFGDTRRHVRVLALARDAAARVIERDPKLRSKAHVDAKRAVDTLARNVVHEEAG